MVQIQIWQSGDKIKDDRFEIIKVLGKGGFGITYLAKDEKKQQQVVIKTLNAAQQGESTFESIQEKFVNEGMDLRSFDHPYIVKSYEMVLIDSLWGLVMEYIPGKDLYEYVLGQGRLYEAEALGYIDQIAQALDFVHQKKFFHRDVKPHNIMLRQQQQEAVLIDFGIAKEYAEQQTIYLSNSLGTELYKPIEQYEQSGRFGPYTDIYALAVTLYHLVTGNAPGGGSPLYTSRSRKDALDKGWGANLDEHLWGELVKAEVSDQTRLAIQAGMQIEPSQRPQDMTEFRELLGLVNPNIVSLTEIILNFDKPPVTCAYEKGKRLQACGDYKAAICEFDRAISLQERFANELNPQEADTYYERGYSKRQLGDYQGAVVDFTQAIELIPEDAGAYYNRGLANYQLKNYQETISDFNEAIARNPQYDPYYERGYSKSQLGDCQGAIVDFTAAIELNPQNAHYYCSRGIASYNLKDYSGTIADHTIAIELNPQNAHYYHNRGSANYQLENYPDAITDFTKAIELDPQDADYYNWRGTAKSHLENYPDAIADYTKVIGLDPQNANCYSNRGLSKSKLQDYKGAVADYTKAIELDPQRAMHYSNRASAKDGLKDYEGAVTDYLKAVELDSQNPIYYTKIDSIIKKLQPCEETIVDSSQKILLDMGIDINCKRDVFLNSLAIKLHNGEDYKGAIDQYTKAIELNPQCADYYNSRGISAVRLNLYQNAAYDFSKAIELDSTESVYWYHRGSTNFLLNQYSLAIIDLNKAIELNPEPSSSYFKRGVVRNELCDYQGALEDLNLAIKLEPNYVKAYYHRALVHEKLKDYPNAIKDIDIAIKLEPDNVQFHDIRDSIATSFKFSEFVSLEGYDGTVLTAVFLNNITVIASGRDINMLQKWELYKPFYLSDICVKNINAHMSLSAIFSKDRNLLATGEYDSRVMLWDVKNRKLLATFSGFGGLASCLAFAPNSKNLAVGSMDNSVALLNIETGQAFVASHADNVKSIAFSPDGNIIASGSEDRTIRFWGDKMTSVRVLSGHNDAVMSLAFSPDGNYIASGSADGDINLWEVETGELIRTFEGNGVVKALAFQPSTNVLASGGFDKKIRLWDLDSEILLTTLTGHQDHIYSLEFSSDGQILVSASGDKTVRLWGNSDTLHQWNVDIDSIPF